LVGKFLEKGEAGETKREGRGCQSMSPSASLNKGEAKRQEAANQ